jgi:phage terminase large subunit
VVAQKRKTVEAVESTFDWLNPNYEPIYAQRAKWLKKLRDNPELLQGVKEHYKHNPVDFLVDWGFTFDPRNVERDLPAVVPFVLFERQEEFIDWLVEKWKGRNDGLAEKSRDMGVSWLCVGFAVWMWLFHPGSVVGFGSRKEEYVDKIGDPKSLFWKIRQFINLLPKEFRPAGYTEKTHAPHMRVLNPENGASIIGEAGDNIGRGNRTSIRRFMSMRWRLMPRCLRPRIARSMCPPPTG